MRGEGEEGDEVTDELLQEVLEAKAVIVNLHRRCVKRLKGSKGEGDAVLLYVLSTFKDKAVEVGSLVGKRIRQRKAKTDKGKVKDSPRVEDEGMMDVDEEEDKVDEDGEQGDEDNPVRRYGNQNKYEWKLIREFKDLGEAVEYIQEGLRTYRKGATRRVGKRWNKTWYHCKMMKGCPCKLLIVEDDQEGNGGGVVKMYSNGRDHVGHEIEEEGTASSPATDKHQQKVRDEDNESSEEEEDNQEEGEGTDDEAEDDVVNNYGNRNQKNEWHLLKKFEGSGALEQAREYIKGLKSCVYGSKKKFRGRYLKTWLHCRNKSSTGCPAKWLLVVDEENCRIARVYDNGKQHVGHDPQKGTDTPTSTPSLKLRHRIIMRQEEDDEGDDESEEDEEDEDEEDSEMECTDVEEEEVNEKGTDGDEHDGVKSYGNQKYEWRFSKQFEGFEEAQEHVKGLNGYHTRSKNRVGDRWNKTRYRCKVRTCPRRVLLVEDDEEGKGEGVVRMYFNEKEHVCGQVTEGGGKGTPNPSTSTGKCQEEKETGDDDDNESDFEEEEGMSEEDDDEHEEMEADHFLKGSHQWEFQRKFRNFEMAKDYIQRSKIYCYRTKQTSKKCIKTWYYCRIEGCPSRLMLAKSTNDEDKDKEIRMYKTVQEHVGHKVTDGGGVWCPIPSTSASQQEESGDDDSEEDCEMEGVNDDNEDTNNESEDDEEVVKHRGRGQIYDWELHPMKFGNIDVAQKYIEETDTYTYRGHRTKEGKWVKMRYYCKDSTCPHRMILAIHENEMKVKMLINGEKHLCHQKHTEEGEGDRISSEPQQQENVDDSKSESMEDEDHHDHDGKEAAEGMDEGDKDEDKSADEHEEMGTDDRDQEEDPILKKCGKYQWEFQRTFRNLGKAKDCIKRSNIHRPGKRKVSKNWIKSWYSCRTSGCPSKIMLVESTIEGEEEVKMYKTVGEHVGHNILGEEEERKPPKLTPEHQIRQDNQPGDRDKFMVKDCRVYLDQLERPHSADCDGKMMEMDKLEEIDPPPPILLTYDDEDMINDIQSKNVDGSANAVNENNEKEELTETTDTEEKDKDHSALTTEAEESQENHNPGDTGSAVDDPYPPDDDEEEGILFEISESEEQEEESSPSPPLLTKVDRHEQDREGVAVSSGDQVEKEQEKNCEGGGRGSSVDQLIDDGNELNGDKKDTSNATPHSDEMELETSPLLPGDDDSSPPPLLIKECDEGVISDQDENKEEVSDTDSSTDLEKSEDKDKDKGHQACNGNFKDSFPSQEMACSEDKEEEHKKGEGRMTVDTPPPLEDSQEEEEVQPVIVEIVEEEEDEEDYLTQSDDDNEEEEKQEEPCISMANFFDEAEDDQQESDLINMPPVKKRKLSTSDSLTPGEGSMPIVGQGANFSTSPPINPAGIPCKIFKCGYCPDRSYLLLEDFSRHLQQAHGMGGATCPNCKLMFASTDNLQKHFQSVHLDQRPFQGSYCTKSFAQTYSVDNHTQRIHPTVMGSGGGLFAAGGVMRRKRPATPTAADADLPHSMNVHPPSAPKGSKWGFHAKFPTSQEAFKYIRNTGKYMQTACSNTDQLRKQWYTCHVAECPRKLLLLLPSIEGEYKSLYDNGKDHNHTVTSPSVCARASGGRQQEMFYLMDEDGDTNEDGTMMYVIEDEETEETTPPHPLANLDLDYEMVEEGEEDEQDMIMENGGYDEGQGSSSSSHPMVYVMADEDENGEGEEEEEWILAGGDGEGSALEGEEQEGTMFYSYST